jgi:Holliday junction resolvasome RuvABC ATP-dependent DNA helicase subunit
VTFIIGGLVLLLVSMLIPRPRRVKTYLRYDHGYTNETLLALARTLAPDRMRVAAPVTGVGGTTNNITVNNLPGAVAQATRLLGVRPDEPIPFKPGEPTTLEEFELQAQLVDKLQMQLRAAGPGRTMGPQLFLGPGGTGKTLLAKCVANDQRHLWEAAQLPTGPFLEVLADFGSKDDLDAYVRVAQQYPGTTLFFDEVHGLSRDQRLQLYELLDNRRYRFKGEAHPVPIPHVLLIAATTDPGQMEEPFLRRWRRNRLKAATPEEMRRVLEDRTSKRDLTVDTKALALIIERTHHSGAPWEAVELFDSAVVSAQSRNSPYVELIDVERVFRQEELDEFGLRDIDRQVIRALLGLGSPNRQGVMEYAASEQTICALVKIDRDEYRQYIRPRLMARGLLLVRHKQFLTNDAVARYGYLA